MKTVVAVQARLNSERLPKKVLLDLGGKPMLSQIVRRCKASGLDVAISCPPQDAREIMKETGHIPIVGPETDILTRMLNVAYELHASYVVRVTGDCPFIPWDGLKWVTENHIESKPKVVQNWKPRVHPDGFDFEFWNVDYLEDLDKRLKGEDREWFAQWAIENDGPGVHIPCSPTLAHWRLTVDYPEDIEVAREIYQAMGDEVWDTRTLVTWLARNPTVLAGNASRIKDFGARPK